MSQLISFLKSKVFLVQLVKAIALLVLVAFVFSQYLKWNTHHGESIQVPNLQGVELEQMIPLLKESNLRYTVIDSSKFDPNFPPFAVLDQSPKAGKMVKENRKIYLTLNPSGYNNVTIPDVIQITKRNAISKLQAVGLQLGEVSYINALGKDMVYEIKFHGKPIRVGDKLPKMSKIELVCGDGTRPQL